MKKFKSLLISFLIVVCAVCIGVAFAACSNKGDKSESKYGYGEEGVYYYSADSETDYLMTLQSGTYMISLKGVSSYSGTYSYDAEANTVSFKTSDGEKFEASFTDDAMQLAVAGTPYTFLKKVDYSVKFVDGSTTIATQSVTYGKSAEAVDKEKSGYIFIGWYEDASFTTRYQFNTAVTCDVTLYAYYIPVDDTISNYTVTFVSDGEVVGETTTQNGVVLEKDMPDVGGIIGWWVSDTNREDELTYAYDGRVLSESTKFFAVKTGTLGASVYDDRVTWAGSASSVTITVDGTVVTSSAVGGTYSYDFGSLLTGRHEIEVSASGYGTETLVYVANGLSRVSNFLVYGTTLVYNAVAGAQYYYISVTCANSSHDHTMVYNGNTLTYDFGNCEMGPDGITFTVYAYGAGYAESVSETFVYLLKMNDAVVTIDEDADTASWAPVYDVTGTQVAAAYEVYVNGGLADTVTDTSYSFKNYERGTEIRVSVKPVVPGYYSEESEAKSYTKTSLMAPEITEISDYCISWTEVDGAAGYEVNVNGYLIDLYPVTEGESAPTKIYIGNGNDGEGASEYYSYILDGVNVISVMAIAREGRNSQFGDAVYATELTMYPVLSYRDGVISWTAALAAGTYYVDYEGTVTEVEGAISFDITFTHSGENVVKVYFDGDSYAEISIYTYAVIFVEGDFSSEIIDTMYVAKNDKVVLPAPEGIMTIDEFVGWYTLPDEYDVMSDGYTGDGSVFVSGSVFDRNSDLVLYACWLREKAELSLDAGDYGYMEDAAAAKVPYASTEYTLPVPVVGDTTKVFKGWYSDPTTGVQYTDERGRAVAVYAGQSAATLYARWGTVIKLSTTTYNNEIVLKAEKGSDDDMKYLTDGVVTVPETYVVGGKEYSVGVLNSNAFANCEYIRVINIPDTVQYVATANNGYAAGSGAFARSANLEAVNVYVTGDGPDPVKDVKYYSEDGVLFGKNTLTSGLELIFYPQAKTQANYEIPETVVNEFECEYREGSAGEYVQVQNPVTTIPVQVFSAHPYLTNVTIPATVTEINSQAFYNCKKLENVTILATTRDGDIPAATSLTIANDAFKSCTAITTVTLASRLDADSFTYTMFSGCTNLTAVYVNTTGDSSIDNYTSTFDGLLLNADGNTLVYYPCGRSEFTLTDASVIYIGEYAAYGNTNFTSVTIPQRIQKIGENAFAGCSNIATLEFASKGSPDAASLEICSMAFYNCKALTTLSLPENLTVIGAYAFGGCTRLSHVEFDSYANANLDYADYAFATSSGTFYLTSLSIGANAPVVDIASIFGYNLTDIKIADGSNYMRTDDGLILDAAGTRVLYCFADCAGSITLPGTVSELGDNVFRGRGLTSISIPVSVTKIGANTFYNCKSLVTVTFADSATSGLVIGEAAFYGCTALTSITIPSGCTEIGDRAFYGCTSLSSVTMKDGLETLGDYVFYNCASLSTVTLPSTITSIGSEEYGMYYVFANCDSLTNISIEGSESTFKIENGIIYGLSKNELWEEGGDNTDVSEYVETTVYLATSAATGEITIPSTVESIMYRAFYGNKGITKISFAGGAVAGGLTIGTEAFANCTGLTEFDLPEGLTEISSGLFSGCTNLATVTVPTTVTKMENNAFSGTKLSSITFTEVEEGEPAQPLELAEGTSSTNFVFYGTQLTSVELPERLTKVPAYAFYGLTTLVSVSVPATVTSIGKNAFTKCTNLTSVTFADGSGLKTIGQGAFYSDTSLATITLPDSVEEIAAGSSAGNTTEGNYLKDDTAGAFSHCTALEAINIPASLEVISQNTFTMCTALTSLTIPTNSTLTEIGDYAFLEDYRFGPTLDLSNAAELVKIGAFAFYCEYAVMENEGQSTFATITWPTDCKIEEIGEYAFYCTALTEISIPASVETIGDEAFAYQIDWSDDDTCCSLKSLQFETDESGKSHLRYIGEYAFDFMYYIEELTLPETYEELVIEAGAFADTSIKTAYIPSTVKKINGIFGGVYSSLDDTPVITSLTVGEGSIFTIKTLSSDTVLVLSSGDTSSASDDGPYTLCCAFNVKSTVDLSCSATGININVIGEDAFRIDNVMTTVTIPYTVTYIDSGAFYSCKKLTTVNFEALPTGYSTDQYALTFAEGESSVASGNTISVFRGCSKLTSVSLPERLVSIPAYTFYGCTANGFTTLAVPDTVTRIGSNAFGDKTSTTSSTNDSPLTSITFGDSSQLTRIDGSAFKGCSKLTSITLPKGVTSLTGGSEFYLCTALKNVTFLADSVTLSGETTFYYCTALESINMAGFTSLPSNTFQNCTSLTSVVIPYTVTSMGTAVFQSCSNLKTVTFEDVPSGAVKDDYPLTMADGGSSSGVFYSCSSLATVILPDRVARIGNYAFSGCTSLKVLTYTGDTGYDKEVDYSSYFALPDGVVLGNYAFSGTGFTSVDISGINAEESGSYIFNGCTSLTSVTLGDMMTVIPSYIFNGCSALTSIEIPSAVTVIGAGAFAGTGITTFALPEYVTTIADDVFSGCTSLASIDLTGVTQIGSGAFKGCTKLTSLDLSGVETIGTSSFEGSAITTADLSSLKISGMGDASSAFSGCTTLTTVVLSSEIKYISDSMFDGCTSLTSIYYEGYENDGYEEGQNVLPDGVLGIGQAAFRNSVFDNIVIPGSVEEIQAGSYSVSNRGVETCYGVFYGNTNLSTVVLGEGIKTIGSHAFYGCTSLTEIVIPASVEVIGSGAFAACTNLSSVEFDEFLSTGEVNMNVLTFWGGNNGYDGVFGMDTALTEITLPERTTEMGACMFYNCTGLVSVTIPQSCTYFSRTVDATSSTTTANTFYGCTSLETVIFGAGSAADEIPGGMFYGCTSLEVVNMPESVETIGANAFVSCTSLKSVTLPKGLLSIGSSAFMSSGLEQISIPDECNEIGDRAFDSCHNLTDINVMSNNKSYESHDGVLTDTTGSIICFPAGREGEAVIDDNLSLSVTYAFSGCAKLTRVILGEGCAYIPQCTFDTCTSLVDIVIPLTCTEIAKSAVYNCSAFTTVYYAGTADRWDEIVMDSTNVNLLAATVFFYSASEPAFSDDFTDYDGNYWRYGDGYEIVVWTFAYTVYTAETDGYVLYDETEDEISWIYIGSELYSVTSEKTDGGFVATAGDGTSYMVTLDGETNSATVTEITETGSAGNGN